MAKIRLVGAGPGSKEYVTPIAKKAVEKAEVLIGSEKALNAFEPIEGETLSLTAQNISEALKYAVDSAEKGKKVLVLSTGDPCFSGLLRPLMKFVSKDVEVEVIPGISSIQVCAARFNICWDEACLFSFHAEVSSEKKMRLVDAVKGGRDVILFPNPKSFPPCEVANFLIEQGVAKETPVGICENLTLNHERSIITTLEEILNLDFSSLCVIVVGTSNNQKNQ